jgi:GT2 family glycosyltransferase
MQLSSIIVNYQSREPLLTCLRTLAENTAGLATETVVIDNSPGDGAAEAVARDFPAVRWITNPENIGFAQAVNQGIAASTGPFVLLVNPDCEFRPGAIPTLLAWHAEHPGTGIAAPRVTNPDGSVEFSARSYPGPLTFLFNRYSLLTRLFPGNPWSRRYLLTDWNHDTPRDVDWVSGACMCASRAAIDAVGPMDGGFFMFNEDVDWCRRMNQAGWKVTYVPDAVVVHHIGASRTRVSPKVIVERHRGMIRYFRKHHPVNPLLGLLVDGLVMTRAGLMLAANALRPR